MTNLKSISTLTVTQSNDIVYSQFVATVTMSGLSVGDSIQLSTTFPSYFYPNSQPSCTTSVINCQSSAILQVLTVASNNLTTFSFDLVNQAFLGFYQLTFTVYSDSTHIYGKQSSSFTMNAGTYNTLIVNSSQSNPYLS